MAQETRSNPIVSIIVFVVLGLIAFWFLFFSPKIVKRANDKPIISVPIQNTTAVYAGLDRSFRTDPPKLEVIDQAYRLASALHKADEYSASFEILKMMSDRGHVDSIILLADQYRRGDGVRPNSKRAIKLYEAAADEGRMDAAYALAEFLRLGGEGLTPDLQRAKKMYEVAANGGYTPAVDRLRMLSGTP